jgi:hypothetical protein
LSGPKLYDAYQFSKKSKSLYPMHSFLSAILTVMCNVTTPTSYPPILLFYTMWSCTHNFLCTILTDTYHVNMLYGSCASCTRPPIHHFTIIFMHPSMPSWKIRLLADYSWARCQNRSAAVCRIPDFDRLAAIFAGLRYLAHVAGESPGANLVALGLSIASEGPVSSGIHRRTCCTFHHCRPAVAKKN